MSQRRHKPGNSGPAGFSSTRQDDPNDLDESERLLKEKKRAQNRLSQHHFRERQASYIRHLELSLQQARATNPGTESGQGSSACLIKENRELREVLLRIRRKLFAWSAAGASIADDPIYDSIFCDTNGTSGPSHGDVSAVGTTQGVLGHRTSENPNGSAKSHLHLWDHAIATASSQVNLFNNILLDSDLSQRWDTLPDSTAAVGEPSEAPETRHPFGRNLLDSSMNRELDPQVTTIPATLGDRVLYKVERLIKDCISRLSLKTVQSEVAPDLDQPCDNDAICKDLDHFVLTSLVKPASRIVLRTLRMDRYIETIGALESYAALLLWRVQTTDKNRLAVPEPLRPTPLQAMCRKLNASIDFVMWGTLRDQLILYHGRYDLDELLDDCHLSTVIEDTRLGVAYLVVDTYLRIMQPSSPSISTAVPATQFIRDSNNCLLDGQQASSTLLKAQYSGMNRFADRKLLPNFAAKYSFLDIASITTSYVVVPYSVVQQY